MNAKKRRPAQSQKEQMKVYTFNQSNQPIRVEVIDNEPWFVAKDVCDVLEHTNHKVAIQGLDEDEVRKVYLIDNLGRKQETYVINESGMYALIVRSNKSQAKPFRKWVTSEVLPSIRKTGQYKIERTRLRPELAIPDDLPNFPRNHIFNTDYIEVRNYPIRRVTINGQFYYCLVDVQVAAGMDTRHRGQLNREIRKTYSFKIQTKNNSKLAEYLNAEGIQILCSRSPIDSAKQFLVEFNQLIIPFNFIVRDYKKFDYERFLEIIIKTKDESDRAFLFELYKTLGGVAL